MNHSVQSSTQMSQVIAKSLIDSAFKARLIADPMATLSAEGVSIPSGLEIRAYENTQNVFNLVIPAQPILLREDDDIPSNNAPTACCKPVGWPNHREMNW